MIPYVLSLALLGVDSEVWVPLLAAFLGASGAGAYNYFLKRREERRELRALVRLVRNELREGRAILSNLSRVTVDNEILRYSSVYAPDDRVWHEQQVVLGRHLKTTSEWDRIRAAYGRMGLVSLVAHRSNDGERTRTWLKATVLTIDKAIAVCERHAGDLDPLAHGPVRRWWSVMVQKREPSPMDAPDEFEQTAFLLWQRTAKAELPESRGPAAHGLEEDA